MNFKMSNFHQIHKSLNDAEQANKPSFVHLDSFKARWMVIPLTPEIAYPSLLSLGKDLTF